MKTDKASSQIRSPPQVKPELPATISSVTLEAISGLSEKRLRQLADQNKLPPAKSGRWKTSESVLGLISHYRTCAVADELEVARIAKLEVETSLLEMERGLKEGRLCVTAEIIEVMQRGLQAMTATVMGTTDLLVEKREAIVLKLREAAELVANSFSKKT